ncbi:glycine-rich domain-containing protein [Planktomarina sp.]|uniref:glycine-rich domain-containing protein n=1 Tax=Planktomarina sp. TaxID=2024851 RepID=UPI00326092C8
MAINRFSKSGITYNQRGHIAPVRGGEATGGTITDVTVNGFDYRVHTFTSGGTFTVVKPGEYQVLVVAGGAGGGTGGQGAGGGAGGMEEDFLDLTAEAISVTVGAGGAAESNGSASSFGAYLSTSGGGRGGRNALTGASGGSGGGGGTGGNSSYNAAGNGTSQSLLADEGFRGGNGYGCCPGDAGPRTGGGGGGAAETPPNASSNNPGRGGDGRISNVTGTDVYYAGGGAGGPEAKTGGLGGGGDTGVAGVDGLGGGGGMGSIGGDGIVIVRYLIG